MTLSKSNCFHMSVGLFVFNKVTEKVMDEFYKSLDG